MANNADPRRLRCIFEVGKNGKNEAVRKPKMDELSYAAKMRGSADLYPAFSSCSIYNPSSSCSLQFTCSSRLNACRIKISLLLLLATSSVDSLRNSNASNLIKPRWMRGPQQPPDCLPCQVPRPQRRVFAHPAVTCIFFCCSAGAKIWPPLFQKKTG